MSDVRIVVDHMKLEYTGLFEVNNLFRTIDSWLFERHFEKRTNKNFEQETPHGKFIEWEIATWKKISDYQKFIIKVRMLMYNLKKVDAVKDKKKNKMGHARILLYFDGYLESDYEHRWDERPLFIFFRTIYDKYIYKIYTERFEQRLTGEVHHLYDHIEKFLNTYRHWHPVSKMPHI